MTVITLDNIKNEKHRKVLKYISDIFDENRGRITDNVAFTSFKDSNHTILFNTLSPELNGKSLIQFDNDKLLFAPVDINSIICNEPANNPSINMLIIPKNKNTWEARSNDKILKFLIRFDKKQQISGFSIMFADAMRTKYKISLTLANDDDEILSQVPSNMESSWDTNNHQFFQLSNTVDGVTKAVMDIELVGVNKDFEWKINNISFYSNMNRESLKSLAELGIITWMPVNNAVLIKDLDQQQDGGKTAELLKLGQEEQSSSSLQAPSILNIETDHYGSPIPYKPIKNRQYFDNLSADELIKISNMNRLYTITDLPTGDKIYTFETNSSNNNNELTIKFSPLEEMNKYPDEPVVELDKLTKPPGMIKKGGFKNYVLTFYIRLDGLIMTDQELIWKYGGYYFNQSRPELSKAVNVSIPINNKLGDKPHVSTEYTFGIKRFMDHSVNIIPAEENPFNGLEEGKWIGIQCIRQVDTENKQATQLVRINRDPFNSENNSINTNNFEDYLLFYDTEMNDHIPHIWGGTQELISVRGSKYVSLYGISLYETELEKEKEES